LPEGRRDLVGNAGEALAWADTYADVGDYPFALRWLELADSLIGPPLPAAYEAKRAVWKHATGMGEARARRLVQARR
jgi:hypothetical protein